MKTYLVFVDGIQIVDFVIKAANHNAAEKKARKLFPDSNVTVQYTEL